MRRFKMSVRICPLCKSKLFGKNRYFDFDFSAHDECIMKEKSRYSEQRPARTSTPVSEVELSPAPSFSDSVTDFFYQSWKSGLHSDDTCSARHSNQRNQPFFVLQPVSYTPQVVYVNTVIYQPYIPASYVQQVGYRPDGTFGVLPTYWS